MLSLESCNFPLQLCHKLNLQCGTTCCPGLLTTLGHSNEVPNRIGVGACILLSCALDQALAEGAFPRPLPPGLLAGADPALFGELCFSPHCPQNLFAGWHLALQLPHVHHEAMAVWVGGLPPPPWCLARRRLACSTARTPRALCRALRSRRCHAGSGPLRGAVRK